MKVESYWSGKKTIGLMSMLIIKSCSLAQVSVGGKVTDQDQTLAGVTLALLTLDSVMISAAVSDTSGQFTFKGVTSGTYQISATMMGYSAFTSGKILVSKDDIFLPAIKLEERSIALQEVTIQADNPACRRGIERVFLSLDQPLKFDFL